MMTAVNIVTAICFILLSGAVAYVVGSFIKKRSRKERIAFVRSFKRGKCLAILVISVPLMCLGYIYKGQGVVDGIFSAISHMIDLVVLKFGLDKVKELSSDSLFYRITLYYCCVLVTVNALLFALSILSQSMWHLRNSASFKLSRKNKVYIFGYNKNSLSIYSSIVSERGVVVDSIGRDGKVSLYVDKVNYLALDDSAAVESIFDRLAKGQNKITVIINTDSDERNLDICRLFVDAITQKDKPAQEILFDRLAIYFFCDPKFETVCNGLVKSSCGCMHYKNKYQMIASNFIERYPLASFMDSRHIDYATALVKDGVDINVCMIGFGNTNRQIFLTSVANNQFLTGCDDVADKVALKQVKYHIFDKTPAENNKNLNHSYYRYRNEYKQNSDLNTSDYLPLPELPAKEYYFHLDVNEADFYDKIKCALAGGKNLDGESNNANFVVIAYGSDLENIDMARKLVEKRNEWGIGDLTIFVKARKSYSFPTLFSEGDVIFIGDERQDVYNLEEITGDSIYRMAKMRNAIYDLEYSATHDDSFVASDEAIEKSKAQSHREWFVKRSQLERDSSLYCCLSLKSKLNLMGLDYCKKEDDGDAMQEAEYLEYYAQDDMPDFKTYGKQIDGKKIIYYSLDFPQSRRKNLAILEHYRWNSYMISRGFIPATREQILAEPSNGKNYELRRHGNLTTFDGLIEFRQTVAAKKGATQLQTDVIKYDYQILDDAYWLLDSNGYKIVKKQDSKE